LFILLIPAALFGHGPTAAVRVTVRVPLVASVEGPAQVVLAPGELVRVRVRVAANLPWVLSVRSRNAQVFLPAPLTGPAGGAAENYRDMEVRCSPQAPGPQTVDLVYTLVTR
jgi:hypothetical protein